MDHRLLDQHRPTRSCSPQTPTAHPIDQRGYPALTVIAWAALVTLLLGPVGVFGQTPPTPGPDQPNPAPSPFPQPKIEFPETQYEWETVLQGQVMKHSFRVLNRGDAPLKILRINSNCGCTSSFYSKEIAPGKEGLVELTVDTGKTPAGYLRKSATIFSNDPTAGQIQLWMIGQVNPLLQSPAPLLKVSGVVGEGKESEFTFEPGTDLPTTVHSAKVVGTNLELVKLEKLDSGGARVTLKGGPGEAPGMLRDELVIVVQVGEQAAVETTYGVVLEHLDPIRITPGGNVVFYRRQTAHLERNPNREVSKEIVFRSQRPDLNFQIEEVRIEGAPEGLFQTEFRTVVPGQHYVVKVRVMKVLGQSQVTGRLIVVTDQPGEPTREREVIAQFRLRSPSG